MRSTSERLINRGNLGMARMFSDLLMEGKEPPLVEEQGEAVRLVFAAGDLSPSFRAFVTEESDRGHLLSVDNLLILRHLLQHPETDTATAARLCQRQEAEAREILSQMEREFGYLRRGGSGRGTYWTLDAGLYARLGAPGHPDRDRRVDWEAAKTRVLSILRQRAERGEPGLTNAEIRQITRLDRAQVVRLMAELRREDPCVLSPGRGKYARHTYNQGGNARGNAISH